jgi:hypothetical protein
VTKKSDTQRGRYASSSYSTIMGDETEKIMNLKKKKKKTKNSDVMLSDP